MFLRFWLRHEFIASHTIGDKQPRPPMNDDKRQREIDDDFAESQTIVAFWVCPHSFRIADSFRVCWSAMYSASSWPPEEPPSALQSDFRTTISRPRDWSFNSHTRHLLQACEACSMSPPSTAFLSNWVVYKAGVRLVLEDPIQVYWSSVVAHPTHIPQVRSTLPMSMTCAGWGWSKHWGGGSHNTSSLIVRTCWRANGGLVRQQHVESIRTEDLYQSMSRKKAW